jgi:ATP-dependent protease ClpP protease subunit
MLSKRPHYNFKKNNKLRNKKFNTDSLSSDTENNKPKMHHDDEDDISVTVDGNNIYFHADVCDESIAQLIVIINKKNNEFKKLLQSDMVESAKPKNLMLFITSYGGCVFSCMRAVDAIISSDIPIYTCISGYSASAGTLMSVVGKRRYMTPSSYMLIHQASSGMRGNFWQLRDEFENMDMIMEDIYNIYSENSKMTREQLEEQLAHDSWMKCDKCISLGLVDEIYRGQ